MHQRRNGKVNSNKNSKQAMMRSNYSYSNMESGMNHSNGDTNSSIMEAQNNESIDELTEQVARLKGLTIEIGNEVREQNNILDNLGNSFGNVGDLLQGTMRRVSSLLDRGGAKHMFYLIAFVVGVMVFLYWVVSHKS